MTTDDRYLTIAKPVITTLKIERSEFIAHVAEADSEKAAKRFIADIEGKHKQATHNCYAYRVVEQGREISYYSDDGEPSGTAGKPILGAIMSTGVTNTVVVVTRYFGGKKLGVRGLIEAYGRAAKEGILEAGIVERVMTTAFGLICSYPQLNEIIYHINKLGLEITASDYQEKVSLQLSVPLSKEGLAKDTLAPLVEKFFNPMEV